MKSHAAVLREIDAAPAMQPLFRHTALDLGIVLTRPFIAEICADKVGEDRNLRTDEIRHDPVYNAQTENSNDALLIQPRAVRTDPR